MKRLVRALLPSPIYDNVKDANAKLASSLLRRLDPPRLKQVLRENDLNAAKLSDFYSPLPDVEALRKTRDRWNRPSAMGGVDMDLDAFKARLSRIFDAYSAELKTIPSNQEMRQKKYGPGFPVVDGAVLYCMIRDLKPKRWLEIGSGLSTAYCSLAAEKNAADGVACEMTCIDPFTGPAVSELPNVKAVADEAQNADLALFDTLEAGDVLFIDSTHIVKVDGEVPYLFLEVLPRLKPGVIVHVHDIFFPYNIPHPAEKYIFDWAETRWPVFWNEAMLLQAFLAYNSAFKIILSNAMIRFQDESFMKSLIDDYPTFDVDRYETHYGSIWMERTA